MRKAAILACLFFLPALTGCTMSDALMAVLGESSYSGGGTTRAEKDYDIDRRVQAAENYGSWDR